MNTLEKVKWGFIGCGEVTTLDLIFSLVALKLQSTTFLNRLSISLVTD